jgi:acyl transferase domain-containing protein
MPRPMIFMYSGQGSQYYHMGRELFEQCASIRANLLALDDIAGELLHESVLHHLYDPRRSRAAPFERTGLTHAAIYMVQSALTKFLLEEGLAPDYLLGASLGTYVAAAVAGCCTEEDGMRTVAAQGRALETSTNRGCMYAVLAPLRLFETNATLQEHTELCGVNFSCHFVIATTLDRSSIVETMLRNQGVRYQRLSVAHAFHSRWVDDLSYVCKQELQQQVYCEANVPLICCMRAGVLDTPPTSAYFWEVVRKPIRFRDTIECLERSSDFIYVDVGPSGTLATFTKYNLSRTSASTCHALMTPHGSNLLTLRALTNELRLMASNSAPAMPRPRLAVRSAADP